MEIRSSGRARNKISRIITMGARSNKPTKKTHTATDMFDNVAWFKAKREQVTEFCLDQRGSTDLDFVDARYLRRSVSPVAEPAELSGYGAYITLFTGSRRCLLRKKLE